MTVPAPPTPVVGIELADAPLPGVPLAVLVTTPADDPAADNRTDPADGDGDPGHAAPAADPADP
ncbi:MAG TPA: hypothetical protein VGD67_00350, partial [Pseudonocardiaceae bacterium]